MSEVRRYRECIERIGVEESPMGNLVALSDYDALKAERDLLLAVVETGGCICDKYPRESCSWHASMDALDTWTRARKGNDDE